MDIEDDVLQAAKDLAKQEGRTAGQVLSDLARKALGSQTSKKALVRGGVTLLPSRGEIVTLEKVQQIMDNEGV